MVRRSWALTLEHLGGGLGQLDEDTAINLEKAEQLECLSLLRVNLVDTTSRQYSKCCKETGTITP